MENNMTPPGFEVQPTFTYKIISESMKFLGDSIMKANAIITLLQEMKSPTWKMQLQLTLQEELSALENELREMNIAKGLTPDGEVQDEHLSD